MLCDRAERAAWRSFEDDPPTMLPHCAGSPPSSARLGFMACAVVCLHENPQNKLPVLFCGKNETNETGHQREMAGNTVIRINIKDDTQASMKGRRFSDIPGTPGTYKRKKKRLPTGTTHPARRWVPKKTVISTQSVIVSFSPHTRVRARQKHAKKCHRAFPESVMRPGARALGPPLFWALAVLRRALRAWALPKATERQGQVQAGRYVEQHARARPRRRASARPREGHAVRFEVQHHDRGPCAPRIQVRP